MNILITGADGQLGSEIKELSDGITGWTFFFTDADSLDITSEMETETFFQRVQPDIVINCAAYTNVDKAESEPETAERINSEAAGILARMALKYHSQLIHISTDYVFDGHLCSPYIETDLENPQNSYGKSKLAGEKIILKENSDSVIIRTSWLYSSYGNNFVKTMLKLGRDCNNVKVIYDQTGTPTYARDLANVLIRLSEIYKNDPVSFIPGIYHYSNEGVASWFDFAKAVFEISETDCTILPVLTEEFQSDAKRPHYTVLNKSKIKTTFNIEIPYWKDSLKDCLSKIQNK